MGCFGINGCISKLPVVYQDKCFLMIGVSNKKETQASPFSFGTGFIFTPIALPVFGQYNDYGCVDEIVRDKNVETIEEIFEADIDDIIDAIDIVMADRYSKDDKEKKLCENVLKKLNIDSKNYSLTFIIDHQFVYDAIANLDIDIGYDFEESLKVSKEFPYTLEDYIKDFEFQKKYNTFRDPCLFDFYSIFNKITNQYVDSHPNSRNKILNVNPNFNEGIYRITEYYDSYVLMQLYKKTYAKVLFDDLGDEYVKFLNFFYKMNALDWNLVIHNYTGQDGRSNVVALKDYYQSIVDFINGSINKK